MATSVPAPMAIPVSAEVRATASLTPSPVIAVNPNSFLRLSTIFDFSSGLTEAKIFEMPAFFPMAFAVISLSPVIMAVPTPIFSSSLTARAASSFRESETAMMPRSFPSAEHKSGVFPSEANLSIWDCIFSFSSASDGLMESKTNFPLPAKIFLCPTVPLIPEPGTST